MKKKIVNVIEKIIKYAGRDDYKFDVEIEMSYIFNLVIYFGMLKIRGAIMSLAIRNVGNKFYVGRNVKFLSRKNLHIGDNVKVYENCRIDALSREGVRLGNEVVIGRRTSIECTGDRQNIGKGIRIGDRSTFASDCFFGAAGGIDIGSDVMGGQYIRFHSENHKFSDPNVLIRLQGVTRRGISVGNNCWIGAGATFLDGSKVGNGCVIAANSVLNKEYPDNSIIGGIPAKVIKSRHSKDNMCG